MDTFQEFVYDMKNSNTRYVNFIELESDFSNIQDDFELANKILDESDDPEIIRSKMKENMELKTIDLDLELSKCRDLDVTNIAPKGKYRVIGTDVYNKKWIQGDFDLLLYAQKVADTVEKDDNIMSIFNDTGECIEEIGVGKIDITFTGENGTTNARHFSDGSSHRYIYKYTLYYASRDGEYTAELTFEWLQLKDMEAVKEMGMILLRRSNRMILEDIEKARVRFLKYEERKIKRVMK